ncbi:ClpP/crotonase-like domain-containing protein [Circinella umbellata]|nr:ClpP/crotonase-like domain-containing protein [Circinella umbellata]
MTTSSSTTAFTYQYETLNVKIYPDGVAHVELNRPDKLNSFSPGVFEDIFQCFTTMSKDSDIHAIVLSGSGRMFTAGIDFKGGALLQGSKDKDLDVARQAFAKQAHLNYLQRSISSLEKCSQPVIVAMHNGVFGVGVDLVTAGDIRYGTKDSYYCVKEVDLGLAPDVGTLQRLPKIIGSASLVRELCYTARIMKSNEALQCGFINRIFDTKEQLIEGAMKTAHEIASKSPVAVVSTKHLLNYSRDHSVDEGLDYTRVWNSAMLMTEDIPKSIEAFVTKTPAKYSKI